MAISRKKLDGRLERRIITGMIVSTEFLKHVALIYRPELFEAPFAAEVSRWCVEYYEQYDKAPGTDIQSVYNSHARDSLNEEVADLISEFLQRLSSDWEEQQDINVAYLLDQTEKRFKERALKMALEDAEALLSKGNVLDAENLITGFKAPMRPSSVGVDPFSDPDVIYSALGEENSKELFQLPGDLGRMLGPFERESFWAILAPEKRGKSWRMIDIANRAWKQRLRVAMFQCGDMSQHATVKRMLSNLVGRHPKYHGKFKMPVVDCAWNQDNSCESSKRPCDFGVLGRKGGLMSLEDAPDYVPCTYCQRKYPDVFKGAVWWREATAERLDWRSAAQYAEDVKRKYRAKTFKLSTYPTKSISVKGIKAQLDIWENTEGWVPDCIFIDYADILAPIDGRKEFRHQENESWENLRSLSLERNCLVMTATQATRDGNKKRQLGMGDISEDKRKLAHVTNAIGLNQTPEEKRSGIMRISQIVVREDDYDIEANACVLQALRIGRPFVGSFFEKDD